jgi:hypothetical protein
MSLPSLPAEEDLREIAFYIADDNMEIFPGSPALLESAMRVLPTYYFVQALESSLSGSISSRFWIHLSVMLGCTIVAFVAGV